MHMQFCLFLLYMYTYVIYLNYKMKMCMIDANVYTKLLETCIFKRISFFKFIHPPIHYRHFVY